MTVGFWWILYEVIIQDQIQMRSNWSINILHPFGQVPLAQTIRAAPRSRATSKVRLYGLRIESEQGWQGNVTRLSFKEMKSTVYREKFQIL